MATSVSMVYASEDVTTSTENTVEQTLSRADDMPETSTPETPTPETPTPETPTPETPTPETPTTETPTTETPTTETPTPETPTTETPTTETPTPETPTTETPTTETPTTETPTTETPTTETPITETPTTETPTTETPTTETPATETPTTETPTTETPPTEIPPTETPTTETPTTEIPPTEIPPTETPTTETPTPETLTTEALTAVTPMAVIQGSSEAIKKVDTTSKVVALTFDDGYGPSTLEILDILSENDIKATFFLAGNTAAKYPISMGELVAQGQELANHSYSHTNFTTLTYDGVQTEVQKAEDAFMNLYGETTKPLVRPPFGAYNDTTLEALGDEGFTHTILYNIDTSDWTKNSADDILEIVIDGIEPGSIILMHSAYGLNTAAALPEIIRQLSEMGYEFVTVSQLLAYDGNVDPDPDPDPTGSSEVISKVDTTSKVVALTFDDGYGPTTLNILDILSDNGIKGTFFLRGDTAAKYPISMRELVAQGQELANHSYSHPDLTTLTYDGVQAEIQLAEDAFKNLYGATTKPLIRVPYGKYDSATLQALGDAGFAYTIQYNIDSKDWSKISAAEIVQHVVASIEPGSIIQMRSDYGLNTAAALPEIIRQLSEMGYEFVTVSQLLTYDGNEEPSPDPEGVTKSPVPGTVTETTYMPGDTEQDIGAIDKNGTIWSVRWDDVVYKSTDGVKFNRVIDINPFLNAGETASLYAMVVSDTGRIILGTNQGRVLVSNEAQTTFDTAFEFEAGWTQNTWGYDKYNQYH